MYRSTSGMFPRAERAGRASEREGPSRRTTPCPGWMCLVMGLLLAGSGCRDAAPAKPAGGDPAAGPGAPMEISYLVPEAVIPWEETEVLVSLDVRSAVDDLTLIITAGKGLDLVTTDTAFAYGSHPAGSSFSEKVTVRSDGVGIRYLNVIASGRFQGTSLGRTAAVPIRTGEGADRAALETPGKIRTGPGGRKIIEMPLPGSGK